MVMFMLLRCFFVLFVLVCRCVHVYAHSFIHSLVHSTDVYGVLYYVLGTMLKAGHMVGFVGKISALSMREEPHPSAAPTGD